VDVYFPLDDLPEQSSWTELLSSVPHLRRLNVVSVSALMLPVLPLHVPLLEHLVLSRGGLDYPNLFATIAHPNIRLLELGPSKASLWLPPSEEEVRSWMGNARLPKLERYIRHPTAGLIE